MQFTEAARALQNDGTVGIIPTDTVYGLVTRASDKDAVKRLYDLKNRVNKPGTLIAANIDQLVELGIKKRYLQAVEQYWPGPLSVIVPCSDDSLEYLHQGRNSLAIRIPAEIRMLWLVETTGPLITTSANQPGEPPANTLQEAQDYFDGEVDFYVDGGNLAGRNPSTVIQIIDDAIEIIRPGEVKIDETGKIL